MQVAAEARMEEFHGFHAEGERLRLRCLGKEVAGVRARALLHLPPSSPASDEGATTTQLQQYCPTTNTLSQSTTLNATTKQISPEVNYSFFSPIR